ncbi:MAG TPA: S8 family serine peptidase [Bacteroidota bacterium]|nr:S8 family serine peptidase [Bacteroidota bacterium]
MARKTLLSAVVVAAVGMFESGAAQSTTQQHSWVFLDQRTVAHTTPQDLGITDRAMKRRAKVLPSDKLIDAFDDPIPQSVLDRIRSTGATIRAESRWLNAVSVAATARQLEALTTLPFVRGIAPVGIGINHPPRPSLAKISAATSTVRTTSSIDYGPSFTQLATEHIPELHAMEIIGTGIVVGLIDDGFNNHRTHVALQNIHVLAEYDFIHNIPNTELQPWEDPGQGNHGAGTLSSIAGFAPGNLIGGAFGVSVLLAKTEMDSSGGVDFASEEDTYVAGLEWEERMGADIASSSLAYKEFAPPDTNYSYSSLDGHTTLVAKAASIAARKGVLLCTAMGNEGFVTRDSNGDIIYEPGTLWSPADADSILAVGATSSDGILASFSGTGPTSDGRVKPDIVAQGTSVYWALGTTSTDFWTVQGTSCSTPIVASVAALVLSAHPEWTPMQVRQAILQTAVHVDDGTSQTAVYPNSLYGYGLANALAAVLSSGPVIADRPIVTVAGNHAAVTTWIRSTSTLKPDSLALYYRLPSASTFTRVPLAQNPDPRYPYQYSAMLPATLIADSMVGYIVASDGVRSRRSPYNAPDSLFTLTRTPDSIVYLFVPGGVATPPTDYILYPNYPNPFNPWTTISFYAPRAEHVELAIYNLLGQKVRTLYSGTASAGAANPFRWIDARDDQGRTVSSGVYFCRLTTPNSVLTTKMLYLK